jgi:hypothetical protein
MVKDWFNVRDSAIRELRRSLPQWLPALKQMVQSKNQERFSARLFNPADVCAGLVLRIL